MRGIPILGSGLCKPERQGDDRRDRVEHQPPATEPRDQHAGGWGWHPLPLQVPLPRPAQSQGEAFGGRLVPNTCTLCIVHLALCMFVAIVRGGKSGRLLVGAKAVLSTWCTARNLHLEVQLCGRHVKVLAISVPLCACSALCNERQLNIYMRAAALLRLLPGP